jgi:hypothetical protein
VGSCNHDRLEVRAASMLVPLGQFIRHWNAGKLHVSARRPITLQGRRMRKVQLMGLAMVLVPLLCIAADRFAAAPGEWELSIEVRLTEAGAARVQAQARQMRQQLRRDLPSQPTAENREGISRESAGRSAVCIAAGGENQDLELLLEQDACQLLNLVTGSRSQQLRAECPKERGTHLLDLRIDTRSGKSLRGTIEMTDNDGNRIGEGTVQGTWVRQECDANTPAFNFQFAEL